MVEPSGHSLLDEYIAAYMEDVEEPPPAPSTVEAPAEPTAAVSEEAPADSDEQDEHETGSALPKWMAAAHDETGAVIEAARQRLFFLLAEGANETQTRKVVTFMLEGLGYDPDSEIRDEFRLEGRHGRNRPDYAVFIGEEVKFCVEAKAIRSSLSDANREQLKDYVEGLDGCEWGVLTNGRCWELYHVPGRADDAWLVSGVDLLDSGWNLEESISELVYLHRQNVRREKWEDIRSIREVLKPHALQAALLNDDILNKLYGQFWSGAGRRHPQKQQELRAAVARLF